MAWLRRLKELLVGVSDRRRVVPHAFARETRRNHEAHKAIADALSRADLAVVEISRRRRNV